MAAFYEHGGLPDIDFLIEAFELMERETRDSGEAGTAPLIETMARVLAARPSISEWQGVPTNAKSPKRPTETATNRPEIATVKSDSWAKLCHCVLIPGTNILAKTAAE